MKDKKIRQSGAPQRQGIRQAHLPLELLLHGGKGGGKLGVFKSSPC